MNKRRTVAWLVAVAVGLTLIPAVDSMARTTKQQKSEQKQNQRITRVVRATAKLGLNVAALTNTVADATKSLTDLTTLTGQIDARLKLIEAGVPQVLDGLTKLQAAAVALKTGLETAGAGLVSLKTLATSTEYGIGQVFIGGTPAGGSFVVTPDVPDAVQQAQTTQAFNAGAQSGVITVRVGVRSAENDGTGASLPAAHCRVTVVAGNNTTTSTANATIGGAPFYPINTKSSLTSTDPANAGFPFGLKAVGADADSTADLTDTTPSTGNAVAPTGTAATATAGLPYTVTLSCVDLSPDAANPAA